jgi:hypothetical protein
LFILQKRIIRISKLVILQKRIIRIITNTGVRESCREAFKNMEIMTYSQYIFSLILFAVKINTYSPQIMKYIYTKPGIIQIFIYQLSI